MIKRCSVPTETIAAKESFYTKLAEPGRKYKISLDENHTVLDACRSRADRRVKNRIALIQPRKGGRPSFGLLYLGAYLLDNKFEVKIFEFLDELYPPNIDENKIIFEDLRKYDPDFIGFGVISSTFRITERIIKKIREEMPGKIIICGGKHCNSNSEEVLRHGANICCVGESEVTLIHLLDALNFETPLETIEGIAYLDDDKIVFTPNRPLLPLDDILKPAFELVDYEKYVNFRLQSIPGHYLRCGFIFGSRGCPYRCKFCTTNLRSLYRERSIDDLLDEMEYQVKTFNIEGFVVLDDLLYFRENRTVELCKKIIERNIKVKMFAHGRVNIVKKETVKLMKDAGVFLLAVGVESGSQKILDAMNKGITIEQIENAFRIYNEVGINTFAFIIVGHPDETEEDRELTRKLLKRISPYNVAVNYYMPMPGTPSYEFEINNAKYLKGGDNFVEFTYTTSEPEFSTSLPLEQLKKIGDEFEGMSMVNRNFNMFRYPRFIYDMFIISVFHPSIILEALYLRYIAKRTNQPSIIVVLKDAIQFYKQRFKNP